MPHSDNVSRKPCDSLFTWCEQLALTEWTVHFVFKLLYTQFWNLVYALNLVIECVKHDKHINMLKWQSRCEFEDFWGWNCNFVYQETFFRFSNWRFKKKTMYDGNQCTNISCHAESSTMGSVIKHRDGRTKIWYCLYFLFIFGWAVYVSWDLCIAYLLVILFLIWHLCLNTPVCKIHVA